MKLLLGLVAVVLGLALGAVAFVLEELSDLLWDLRLLLLEVVQWSQKE